MTDDTPSERACRWPTGPCAVIGVSTDDTPSEGPDLCSSCGYFHTSTARCGPPTDDTPSEGLRAALDDIQSVAIDVTDPPLVRFRNIYAAVRRARAALAASPQEPPGCKRPDEPLSIGLDWCVTHNGRWRLDRDHCGSSTLSPQEPPGIDEEAFSEAMFRVGTGHRVGMTRLPWAYENQQEWARWLGEAVPQVIAEHDRLRARLLSESGSDTAREGPIQDANGDELERGEPDYSGQ